MLDVEYTHNVYAVYVHSIAIKFTSKLKQPFTIDLFYAESALQNFRK